MAAIVGWRQWPVSARASLHTYTARCQYSGWPRHRYQRSCVQLYWTRSSLGAGPASVLQTWDRPIGHHLSLRRSCRGGRRKQWKIRVVCDGATRPRRAASVRPTEQTTVPQRLASASEQNADLQASPHFHTENHSTHECNPLNLILIDTSPCIQGKSQCFKVMSFNSQSCRNKTDDVCDLITQGSYDLVFLTEMWLRPTGDECEMAAVTPPGFTLKSVPRANGTGGVLAVLFRNSLVDCVKCQQWTWLSNRSRCVKRASATKTSQWHSSVFTAPA